MGLRAPNCDQKRMSAEDFVVFFLFSCCCLVERLKVFWTVRHVVVGPLFCATDEECVANAIYILSVGGGAPANGSKGRATPWTQRNFDCTMGFPGEDVAQQPQCRDFTQPAVTYFECLTSLTAN